MQHPTEVVAEIRRNQEAYSKVRADMEQNHWGRVVLMHDGEIVAVYNDGEDAYSIGCEKYGLGRFSLLQVGNRPADLGFHALSLKAWE